MNENNSKTAAEAFQELHEAWVDLWKVTLKELKIYELVNWLTRVLAATQNNEDG